MRFAFALVVNLVRFLLWPLRLMASARAAPRGGWLEVKIDGPVVEVAPRFPVWDRRPRPTALHELRRLVQVAASDARVAGLLVVLKGWQGGNATATTLRRILVRAREQGMRVVVYLPHGGGTRTTFVASAAHQIILAPQSHLAPLGYAVQAQYIKGALDQIGVEPEVLAHGRFKAAGEALVADEMSAEQREQLSALLDDVHRSLIDALAEGRGVSRKLAQQWVDEGPWSASAAIRQGLADGGAHADEVGERLAPERPRGAPIIDYRRYLRRRVLRWRSWRKAPRIGVIELHGPIVPDASLPLPVATGERFTALVERALLDRSVRGVILHVNSPGGSVLVSDQMLHGVRRLAKKKPVVACFGDVAASGGYLAALGAASIHAEPTTITGSIGVVSMRLGVGPLLDRLGIRVATVKRGNRADMHSPARALAPDERAVVERELSEVYDYFVDAVAQGRARSRAEIERVAEGRIYSGCAAQREGLVDGVGGFPDALTDLQGRIGSGAARLEPQVLGARWSLGSVAAGWSARYAVTAWSELVALAIDGERVWMWCPTRVVEVGTSLP
jgi:protease-4